MNKTVQLLAKLKTRALEAEGRALGAECRALEAERRAGAAERRAEEAERRASSFEQMLRVCERGRSLELAAPRGRRPSPRTALL